MARPVDPRLLRYAAASRPFFALLVLIGLAQALVIIAFIPVMLAVIASYRQTVQAYPGGGGDYEVARKNLGRTASMTVARVGRSIFSSRSRVASSPATAG